jgi:hypothetical protein
MDFNKKSGFIFKCIAYLLVLSFSVTSTSIYGAKSALQFDNSNNSDGDISLAVDPNFVHVDSPSNMPLGNDSRTYIAWVKQESGDFGIGTVMSHGAGNCDPHGQTMHLRISNTRFDLGGGCTGWNDLHSGTGSTVGEWTFFATSYENEKVNSWINGTKVGPTIQEHNRSFSVNDDDLWLGAYANRFPNERLGWFTGILDEIAIFKEALSDVEIAEIYNNGAGHILTLESGAYTNTAIANLSAYYTFNEATGTTLTDMSGNNNHGTITGATWVADGVELFPPVDANGFVMATGLHQDTGTAFDLNGLTQTGQEYDDNGFNQFGFNISGTHSNGTAFDDSGYNVKGFNVAGTHTNGTSFDGDGYDGRL